MSWSQESEDYERLRGRGRPPRRRLFVVMFDLFYPALVAAVVTALVCWHFELPLERLLRGAMGDLLRMFG